MYLKKKKRETKPASRRRARRVSVVFRFPEETSWASWDRIRSRSLAFERVGALRWGVIRSLGILLSLPWEATSPLLYS
jgi:hypothetical protein